MRGTETPDEFSNVEKSTKKSAENLLDLRGKGLQNMTSLPKRYSICDLILDNNSITKIEKLDAFPKLCSLSMTNNHLVRMNGVNFGKNLTFVNLSNNGIVSMEGLCWLAHLEYLDLSKNNIKRIQNVSYCTKLKHMDLSENSITDISNLKSLVQLKVLLLRGNTITTLARAEENLPEQTETLLLSENGISDLNEIRHLSCLLNLKHFSILDNPCVMRTTSLPGFDFRPFILCFLMSLVTLDSIVVKDNERQDAESLNRDENITLFSFGHHLQLVLYLSKIFPAHNSTELNKDHNNLLENFLEKQRAEIFTDQKNTENTKSGLATNNSLQSSSYSVLEFSENTQNESGNFSPDEDTLRSESRFLPVYSPLKKSPGTYHRRFQRSLSWDASSPDNVEELPILTDDAASMSDGLPAMTEEEANKLIHFAATIVQSHIRGFLVRRKFDYKIFKRRHTAASRIQAFWRGFYFRRYSLQGLNFKNERRVRRLQKYISTLCLIMQKSEKQHEVEKQQMLEIMTLLYEKCTKLSDKVEELESSTNERIKFERKDQDEPRDLEGTLHPVFSPHPRLLENIEQSGNMHVDTFQNTSKVSRGFSSSENVEYCVKEDEDLVNVIEDVAREDILEKRDTLMDQEDHSGLTEWDKNVQNEEEREDEVMEQEDNPHLIESDDQSVTSEDSVDNRDTNEDKDYHSSDVPRWNGKQESTNKACYVFETSEAPYDDLSTRVAESCAEKATMKSKVGGSSYELLETVQNDEEQDIGETFLNIEELQSCKTKDKVNSLDRVTDNPGASGTINWKDCRVNEFNDNKVEKDSDNGIEDEHEDDQEMKTDMITGECNKHVQANNVIDNLENVPAEAGEQVPQPDWISIEVTKFTSVESNVAEHVLKRIEVDDKLAEDEEKAAECGDDSTECGEDSVECVEDSVECGDNSAECVASSVEHGENFADALEEVQLDDTLKQRTTGSENISEDKKDYYPNKGQFSAVNIEDKSSQNEDTKIDNGEHIGKEKYLKLEEFVTIHNEVDSNAEETERSEFGVAEETRVELGEESEASYKEQEVVDITTMASYGLTEERPDKGESLKDSLDLIESCSTEIRNVDFTNDSTVEGIVYENDGLTEVESKDSVIVNVVGDNAACGGKQNSEPKGPQSNTINMDSTMENTYSNEESSFGNLVEESETENESEIKKISPRASSLLSALKDEIMTGVSSKDIQSRGSSLSAPLASHTFRGDVCDSRDVEPNTTSDLSTFERQEGTNFDDDNFQLALKQNLEC